MNRKEREKAEERKEDSRRYRILREMRALAARLTHV